MKTEHHKDPFLVYVCILTENITLSNVYIITPYDTDGCSVW